MGLRERKRARLLERIEEATLTLIAAGGYEKVTVDAIVQRVDISPPTFYKYFAGKDDVLRAVASRRLRDVLARVPELPEDTALATELQLFIHNLAAWVERDKHLWRAIVLADALNPLRWPEQREPELNLQETLVRRVQRAQECGELGRRFTAELIVSTLVSVQTLTLLQWGVSDWAAGELERRLQEVGAFVLHGAAPYVV